MPSEEVNDATRKEWRDLGFFYDRDDDPRDWRVVGSRSGLVPRPSFALRPKSTKHRKPRTRSLRTMYLKVMTASESGIDRDAIYGAIEDLRRLASLVETKLKTPEPDPHCAFRNSSHRIANIFCCSTCEVRISIRHLPILRYRSQPDNPPLEPMVKCLGILFLPTAQRQNVSPP